MTKVIERFTRFAGARARVNLQIDADAADGVQRKTAVAVPENARTLKFPDFGFEEE